jgi:hypothetical protein
MRGERRAGPLRPSPAQRTWYETAVMYRRALEVLGWPMPRCLPGEPGERECGGTDAEHAASYLGALGAIVGDKVQHLHSRHLDAAAHAAFEETRSELAALPPCGREH